MAARGWPALHAELALLSLPQGKKDGGELLRVEGSASERLGHLRELALYVQRLADRGTYYTFFGPGDAR